MAVDVAVDSGPEGLPFWKKRYRSENCCENISESFVQVSNRRYLSGRSHNRRRHCHNKNQVDWKRVDFLVVHLHPCYFSAFSETKGKVICDEWMSSFQVYVFLIEQNASYANSIKWCSPPSLACWGLSKAFILLESRYLKSRVFVS